MTVPHHYSMKWDNYHSHVGDIFSQLLETGSMADVALYAEGEKINCHKMLLSACSPYFQEILSTAGATNTIVVVSGINGEDVRSIIEFVYRGEISVKADRFASVLKAAEALKICGLMEVSSHLSEMEESEVMRTHNHNAERSSKFFKEDLTSTNHGNVVIKDDKVVSSENTWHCVQMPMPSYNVLEDNKTNCNDNNGNEAEFITTDIINNKSVENNMEVVTEAKETGNVHSKEDPLKLKIEQSNDVSAKQETIANSEEELCEDVKLKGRKDIRKKLYSEEAMLAALEDMKAGKNLVKAAAKHRVPRTTLYMRARAIGAWPAMVRKGYPREKISAALESVAGGSSLQCAATEFGIPKTVLWRRVQKEIGNTASHKRIKPVVTSQVNPKETVVQEGVSITRVSPQYQIPKATLFRWEKVHLRNEMKLPKNFIKDGSSKQEIPHQVQLERAVTITGCKQTLLQGSSADKFKSEKSALWNDSIQNSGSSGHTNQHAVFLKNENEDTEAVEQLKQQQQQSDFHFSETCIEERLILR
ncbi:uncharacterized protein LOC142329395 isoform X2 [Lycorma delicatula]|uniref:uncharacterized protein LOC142329395 isoform X2 n=1 Tax=Lycorma delicatula TaxID=130591 RepID=UPI003F51AAD9